MPTGTGFSDAADVPLRGTGVVDADDAAITSVENTTTASNAAARRVGVALDADAQARPIRLGRSPFILVIAATGPAKYGTLTRSLPSTSVGVGFASFKRCPGHPPGWVQRDSPSAFATALHRLSPPARSVDFNLRKALKRFIE